MRVSGGGQLLVSGAPAGVLCFAPCVSSVLKGAAAAEVHRAACLSQGTRDRTGVTRLTLTATIAEILLGGEPPSSGHDPARAVVGAKSVTIFSAMDRVEEPAWSLRRLWFDRRPMRC